MLFTNLAALMIYQGGVFFSPHWLAIATPIALVLGYWAVRTKAIASWLSVHISCMVSSYYMLAGGAVNRLLLADRSHKPRFVSKSEYGCYDKSPRERRGGDPRTPATERVSARIRDRAKPWRPQNLLQTWLRWT
jgi:hypothetical protein